ncbi:MAG: hypothetical protein GEU93_15015 [Propionibacteriales bacterium]|nr:hypothetical protein [Propionibacteriales bacterium]
MPRGERPHDEGQPNPAVPTSVRLRALMPSLAPARRGMSRTLPVGRRSPSRGGVGGVAVVAVLLPHAGNLDTVPAMAIAAARAAGR